MTSPPPTRYTFPRSMRLSHAREYERVYGAKLRKTRGPLTVSGVPNDLGRPRLGLAISRRVGGAVVRNRIKRMIREAFRGAQHDLPRGSRRDEAPTEQAFDWVVSSRAHEGATAEEYRCWLLEAAVAVVREWERREARRPLRDDDPRSEGLA